jgi:hypothetical protein
MSVRDGGLGRRTIPIPDFTERPMAIDPTARAANSGLQFDRMVSSSDAEGDQVTCGRCNASIVTQYYSADGQILCPKCKQTVDSEQRRLAARAKSPAGFLLAALLGLGATIVGAIIYWGVARVTNLEIALVAILIGFMVGAAVRKGASGAGGRRFQLLAAGLTYLSVGLAYAAIAAGAAQAESDLVATADSTATPASAALLTAGDSSLSTSVDSLRAAVDPLASGGIAVTDPDASEISGGMAFVGLVSLVLALPVLVIFGSLPGGLISALIIGFGMQQAWRMTGSQLRQVTGPYTVKEPLRKTGT